MYNIGKRKIPKLYLEDVSENPCEHCGEAHYVTCGWCEKKKHFEAGISKLKIQNYIKRMYIAYSDRCFEDRDIFSPTEFARLVTENLFFISKKRGE